MFERLNEAEKRFSGIDAELSDPAAAQDIVRFTALLKERASLAPVIEKFRQYKKALSDGEEAKALLDSENDPELLAMADEELKNAKEAAAKYEEELKILLLPKDPLDGKNVVVEIRAGAGGEEAALFAAVLYRMYVMYADASHFRTELVSCNETELGGYKEITFLVNGDGAYSRFKYESGVHRVQRVPETETSGRIHTSTATVAVLPEAEEVEVEINPNDLEIETIKSSGAGGQHVNKTESAIRMVHIPTGIVIECQDERSQFKNRDKAMKLLRARLYDLKRREQSDRIASERRSQVGTGDRSERIRTYNFRESRVTDHRIGLTLYSLESIINGEIGGLIDALATAETAEKLKNGEGNGNDN